jgi:hypothetical protein
VFPIWCHIDWYLITLFLRQFIIIFADLLLKDSSSGENCGYKEINEMHLKWNLGSEIAGDRTGEADILTLGVLFQLISDNPGDLLTLKSQSSILLKGREGVWNYYRSWIWLGTCFSEHSESWWIFEHLRLSVPLRILNTAMSLDIFEWIMNRFYITTSHD